MTDEKTIIAENVNLTVYNTPQRQRACFVKYSQPNIGKRYILDEPEMVAGRSPDIPIHINEPSVSRRHARFVLTAQGVEVEDVGSANGTFVNEEKIQKQILKNNDMVRLGTVLLKFFAHGNIENAITDKLYQQATIDTTTQVFNKQYLTESLESEFKVSRNYKRNLSIIVYDLDFFKKVNDVYGHTAGDFILRETAQLARTAIRKNDILARFGGEEFVIILPDTDNRTAAELAERVRKAVDTHLFKFDNHEIRQTISMGVSQLADSMATTKDLVDDADRKLYIAKNAGRNRVTA